MRIFPNPFTESTLLEFDNENQEKLTLLIYDIAGKLVREYGEIKAERQVIERGNLNPGSYYFRLEGGSGRDAGKFIIE